MVTRLILMLFPSVSHTVSSSWDSLMHRCVERALQCSIFFSMSLGCLGLGSDYTQLGTVQKHTFDSMLEGENHPQLAPPSVIVLLNVFKVD